MRAYQNQMHVYVCIYIYVYVTIIYVCKLMYVFVYMSGPLGHALLARAPAYFGFVLNVGIGIVLGIIISTGPSLGCISIPLKVQSTYT